MRWILYTTESIENPEDALRLIRYYEIRWKIEEFHKIWKTDGTEVEGLRLQKCENIKRAAIIKSFIAVRLFQLKDLVENKKQAKEIACTDYIEEQTWKMLWIKIEKRKAIPKVPPSLNWFYYSIAKLGGWHDSKRTGRVGIKSLWGGWLKLAEMSESVRIFNELQKI